LVTVGVLEEFDGESEWFFFGHDLVPKGFLLAACKDRYYYSAKVSLLLGLLAGGDRTLAACHRRAADIWNAQALAVVNFRTTLIKDNP
jgi:hypothetical protein